MLTPHISNMFSTQSSGGWSDWGGRAWGLEQGCCSRWSLWDFWQEDHSVEYNETLSREQASQGPLLLCRLAELEESRTWDERSEQSQGFIPAYETPGVTAFPKKGLISLDYKEVGSGFLI